MRTLEEYNEHKARVIANSAAAHARIRGIASGQAAVAGGTPLAAKPTVSFAEEPQCSGSGPGSVVKTVLANLGFESLPGCGCELMCEQMNNWGWSGCLLHIREITFFFGRKAKAYGVKASAWTIGRAFVRAFRGGLAGSGGQAETSIDGISSGGSTAVRG